MSHLEARQYSGANDIAALVDFTGAALSARLPRHSYWHPGDIVWMLFTHADMGLFDPTRDIRLWLDQAGRVVGLAWFYAFLAARFDVLPEHHDPVLDQIIEWCENHRRELAQPGESITLSMDAHDHDEARIEALTRHGYAPMTRNVEVTMFRDLARSIPETLLPSGMRLRGCTDIDLDERAECHRDAWSNLAHIGRPDQRSSFTTEKYRRLRSAPLYDPELDIIVETASGGVASCCICWTDPISGVGIFEPVGTRPSYRGLGLTGAMNAEGFRRMRDRGMHTAHIAQSEDNNPTALAAYQKTFIPDGGHRRNYLKRGL